MNYLTFTFTNTHTPSMKLQSSNLPFPKPQTRRKTPKLIPLIALACLLTITPIYYPFRHKKSLFPLQIGNQLREKTITSAPPHLPPPKPSNPTWRRSHTSPAPEKPVENPPPPEKANQTVAEKTEPEKRTGSAGSGNTTRPPEGGHGGPGDKKCELFEGEWIPNPGGPYYTNETCDAIQEHQNCMKFGRPDTGYLKWRWKPDGCELPVFGPFEFLEMVRGKSMVFVGDSVARNHMQSLICLLSKVAHPVDASPPTAENRLYQYTDYDFNVSIISSPYLVRTKRTDPNDFTKPYHLFLDEADRTWAARLHDFDYLIISAAHWFFRPSYFHLNRTLAGCLYCEDANATRLPASFGYHLALRTALRALGGFRGVAFLRTIAPSHFEGGPWDRGGDCPRRRPVGRNEAALEEFAAEVYRIQLEELGRAAEGRVRLFDATKVMVGRADGHPSKYGRPAAANETFPNDCVHWCLPGPIDAWNDLLQELLRKELEGYTQSS